MSITFTWLNNASLDIDSANLWRFSLFNSPYHVHQYAKGIDLYPLEEHLPASMNERTQIIPSPVSGKIMYHTNFKTPKGYGFTSDSHDYLMIVNPQLDGDQPPYYFRMLHVKPMMKIGDIIRQGEPLGTFIKSGFFSAWTDYHLHLELRPINLESSNQYQQWKRAKGSLKIKHVQGTAFSPLDEISVNPCSSFQIKSKIIASNPYYALIQCHDVPFRFIHPNGIEVLVNRRFGILDAGIPYYKTGGIIFAPSNGISTNIPVNQKNIVYFPNGFPIGTLQQETKSYAIFKPNQFTSSYNKIPLRGISSFI